MSNNRYEINIEVKQYLNDEQKKELSANLVQQEIQVALIENEKKAVVSNFNSQIKDIRSLITDIVQKLNVGYQQITQTVECEKDSITGDKRYYDLITGELIRTETNPNLEDIETINMFTTEIEEQEEIKIDKLELTRNDFINIARAKYSIPETIKITSDLAIDSGQLIQLAGDKDELTQWLDSSEIAYSDKTITTLHGGTTILTFYGIDIDAEETAKYILEKYKDLAEEIETLDEFGMSKKDYKKIFRDVYQVPFSISIETDILKVGINDVIFEGYESDMLEWLESINITEGYHREKSDNNLPGQVTYKVENLSITNYQVRNYLDTIEETETLEEELEAIDQPY